MLIASRLEEIVAFAAKIMGTHEFSMCNAITDKLKSRRVLCQTVTLQRRVNRLVITADGRWLMDLNIGWTGVGNHNGRLYLGEKAKLIDYIVEQYKRDSHFELSFKRVCGSTLLLTDENQTTKLSA